MLIDEAVIPETGDGKHGEWAKILTGVEPKARDARGYRGRFVTPGAIRPLPVGTLVLERYRKGRKFSHILWQLERDASWTALVESSKRSWSLELRDVAAEILQTSTTHRSELENRRLDIRSEGRLAQTAKTATRIRVDTPLKCEFCELELDFEPIPGIDAGATEAERWLGDCCGREYRLTTIYRMVEVL